VLPDTVEREFEKVRQSSLQENTRQRRTPFFTSREVLRISNHREGESDRTSQQWPEIRPDLIMIRASCLPSSGPDIGEFARRIYRIIERVLRYGPKDSG
jgi:hypothetical protein